MAPSFTSVEETWKRAEKSSPLSEKSSNNTATSPIPHSSTVAGINLISDAPRLSPPDMPQPCSTSKAAKTYESEAKKRKTDSALSPLIPARTYGEKNHNSKTKAKEPLSTCVFDYDEAESILALGTFKFFRSKGKNANKENEPVETTQKGDKAAKSKAKENKLIKAKKNKVGKRTDTKANKESKPAETEEKKERELDESMEYGDADVMAKTAEQENMAAKTSEKKNKDAQTDESEKASKEYR